jgi:pilus assembly protein CpaB
MRPKTLVLFALALGCGSVAAIGINQLLANRNLPAAAHIDTVPILVAMADVGMGEIVPPESVKLENWPKDKLPPGAISSLDTLKSRRTRVKLFTGEPILEAKLMGVDDETASAAQFIPKGYRVVAVKVDDVSAANSLIKPGDRVDVLVHLRANPGGGITETRTITLLQDIKVFAVNDLFHNNAEADANVAARTVSLLVTPEQAELVTHATEQGAIRLVMRSVDDDEHPDTPGADQNMLLGIADHGDREHEEQQATDDLNALLNKDKPAPPVEPVVQAPLGDSWRMLLIEADKAHEVQFADATRPPTSITDIDSVDAMPAAGPLPLDAPDDGDAEAVDQAPDSGEWNEPESESADGGAAESDAEEQGAEKTSAADENMGNN